MRFLSSLFFLCGSCSLFLREALPKACTEEDPVRCEGDSIVFCIEGLEHAEFCFGCQANNNPSQCEISICGDFSISPGESCDDGNLFSGDGCSNTCQREICGDGIIVDGEECDDGNTEGQDGCSGSCFLEAGNTTFFSEASVGVGGASPENIFVSVFGETSVALPGGPGRALLVLASDGTDICSLITSNGLSVFIGRVQAGQITGETGFLFALDRTSNLTPFGAGVFNGDSVPGNINNLVIDAGFVESASDGTILANTAFGGGNGRLEITTASNNFMTGLFEGSQLTDFSSGQATSIDVPLEVFFEAVRCAAIEEGLQEFVLGAGF